jgi:hypothetical protein
VTSNHRWQIRPILWVVLQARGCDYCACMCRAVIDVPHARVASRVHTARLANTRERRDDGGGGRGFRVVRLSRVQGVQGCPAVLHESSKRGNATDERARTKNCVSLSSLRALKQIISYTRTKTLQLHARTNESSEHIACRLPLHHEDAERWLSKHVHRSAESLHSGPQERSLEALSCSIEDKGACFNKHNALTRIESSTSSSARGRTRLPFMAMVSSPLRFTALHAQMADDHLSILNLPCLRLSISPQLCHLSHLSPIILVGLSKEL